MEIPDHLAGEPLVQLLMSVQHQTLFLCSLLTLSHQGGILISFKQPGDLTEKLNTKNHTLCTNPVLKNTNMQVMSNKVAYMYTTKGDIRSYLSISQQCVHPLEEA